MKILNMFNIKTEALNVGILLGLFLIINFASLEAKAAGDFTVFRPSTSVWYSQSSDDAGAFSAVRWGLATDVLVPADYDGDEQNDIAVWRPEDGIWYIQRSSDANVMYIKWGTSIVYPTGSLPDVPVPADYDGDRVSDIAVWRPDTGIWYVLKSSNGYDQSTPLIFQWGKLGDIPVPSDYDGDGLTDFAIFRSSENRWYIFQSKSQSWQVPVFGSAGYDLLVPADYTGDGKADVAVYRSGTWWVLNSETGLAEQFEFGFYDDIPVPADYDNDGTTDFAVFRKGVWYLYESSKPQFRTYNFGRESDIPVSSAGVRQSIVAIP